MPGDRFYGALQGSFFSLDVPGITTSYFTACSGLSIEMNVVDFKQTDGKKTVVQKRPGGKTTYSEIVMKRGLTSDKSLHDWVQQVADGKVAEARKTASIIVMDSLGAEKARFNIEKAWPSKLKVSDLKTGGDEVMVEELTITHEFLDWV